jgi:inner membrane protein
MDSVTQFALGAGVGAAVLGRAIGPRKAALVGGVLGTLPDLDVYFPYENPVDSFTLHRGPSHSLFVHAAVTPILGEAIRLMFRELRDRLVLVWAGVYLCLATHALLDAMTIYGTRIFWPFWTEPVSIGSIFIIDPLYTVPLLVAMIWAFCTGGWSQRYGRCVAVSLALSTAYLGWTLAAQEIVRGKAALLYGDAAPVLVTPTPFNSILWKVTAVDRDSYYNAYPTVFGDTSAVPVYRHVRRPAGLACPDGIALFDRVAAFSKGFYRVERKGDDIRIADLRMGMTPNYVFQFRIATQKGGRAVPAAPERVFAARRREEGDLGWLYARLAGKNGMRPAERTYALAGTGPAGQQKKSVC